MLGKSSFLREGKYTGYGFGFPLRAWPNCKFSISAISAIFNMSP